MDFFDILAFGEAFPVSDPNDPAFDVADVNRDGTHDFLDTLDFINAFAAHFDPGGGPLSLPAPAAVAILAFGAPLLRRRSR